MQKGFWDNFWKWLTGGYKPPQPQPPVTPTPPPPAPDANETLLRLLTLHNEQRQAHGVPSVSMHEHLNTAAQGHADTMARLQHMSHNAGGTDFQERIRSAGYNLSGGGENIAAGQRTPEAVVQAWMNSPGHKRNILNAYWWHVGFGVAVGGNRLYWCTVFAVPSRRDIGHVDLILLPGGVEEPDVGAKDPRC